MLFNRTVKICVRASTSTITHHDLGLSPCEILLLLALKLTPLRPRTYPGPRALSAQWPNASLFLGTHHRLTKQSVFGTHASPRLAASAGERCRWARAASVRLRALRHQAHVRRRLPGQSVEPHRQRRVCLPQPVLERLVARRVGRVRVRDTGDELRELRLVLSDELLLLGIGLLR